VCVLTLHGILKTYPHPEIASYDVHRGYSLVGRVALEPEPVVYKKNNDEADRGWHIQCADAARRIAAVAFDVSDDALNAPNRCCAHIALARQVAMYLTHVVASVSLSDIATTFSRDRTTVSHACRRVEEKRDELIFDLQLERLEAGMRREMERIRLADILEAKCHQSSDMLLHYGRHTGSYYEHKARILPFRRWRR